MLIYENGDSNGTRITINRSDIWHGDITLTTAQKYIKAPMWQLKTATTMHQEINGWSIKKVSEGDASTKVKPG